MSIFTTIGGWFSSNTNVDQKKGEQTNIASATVTDQAVDVNFDTSMQLSAWWAGLQKWCQVVGSLPVKVQVLKDGLWIDDETSDLTFLFNNKMNLQQTRFDFFQSLILNLKSFGNSYNLIQRGVGDKIIGLIPFSSTQVKMIILDDGTSVYAHTVDGNTTVYKADKIWHIKTFGNGDIGLNTMSYASNAISIGLSGEQRVSQTYKNAGKPPGILTVDADLNDKQHEQVKRTFKDLISGDNLMVLPKGMNYDKTAMSPVDLQLLESRRFQIEDIGRFLDIPSVLINDTAGSTVWGSGITEIITGWHKLSVRPVVLSIAESAKINLVPLTKRFKTRIVFDFDDLLSLGRKDRSDAQQKEINSGIITPNEAREENHRLPHPEGDELMINTAIQPISTLGQEDENETIIT